MKIKDVFEEVTAYATKGDSLYLWGAGRYGEMICSFLDYKEIKIDGFIESVKEKDTLFEIPVYSYDEWIKQAKPNDAVLVTMGRKNREEIEDKLRNLPCDYFIVDSWKISVLRKYQEYYSMWDYVKNDEIDEQKLISDAERYAREKKERIEWLKPLQDKWGFPDWHLNPINDYAFDIADYIAESASKANTVKTVVEVGCGLCNILGNEKLNICKRIGIDMRESIINANKEIWGDKIEFQIGTFDSLKGMNIDYLISVNFLHGIPPKELSDIYQRLFSNNNIQYYIADEVTGNYTYEHALKSLLPSSFNLIDSLGPYESDGGARFIRIYKRDSDIWR